MKRWLLGFGLIGCVIAVVQTRLVAQTGTAAMNGRVTQDGKPVAGVVVLLSPVGNRTVDREQKPPARVVTDGDGRFRLTDLPAGRYRVLAAAPGMVNEEQKAEPYFFGRMIQLSEGETLDNVNFKLAKGGVMTGQVTDPQGQPMIAARLQLLQVQPDGSKRMMQLPMANPFMFQTDDRGVYRLFGLPAGRYAVAVGMNTQNGPVTREGYPMTYHPSATWEKEAAIIEITPGHEASDIDIHIKGERRKRYAVRVRVVDEASGKPLAGQAVGYGPVRNEAPGGFYPANPSAISDAQGYARLPGVLSGRYGAALAPWRNDQQPIEYFSAATPFEVSNGDVEGIEVRAYRGANLSGAVVIEGVGDASLITKLGYEALWAVSYQNGASAASRALTIHRDGTFQVTGLLPGNLRFKLLQEIAPGLMIVRVEAEHATSSGEIPLAPGQTVAGVRLVLAYGSASQPPK
jgi:hypothetical protein